jgi:hypothetical protein
MAKYTILIYGDEAYYAGLTPEGVAAVMDAHGAFAKAVGELGGQLLGGEELNSVTTATSIRAGVTTDGPFVETKETLGGYYLVEARDLDHALAIAKLCPAPSGGVEVRPIIDHSQD